MNDVDERRSRFWVGDEQAEEFATVGTAQILAMHEDRPNDRCRDSVALQLLRTDEFEVFTRFADGVSTAAVPQSAIAYRN